jgi:hypothetical protein
MMKEKEGGCIKARSIERTTSQGEAEVEYAPTKTGFIGCIQKKLGQGTKAVRSVKGDEE